MENENDEEFISNNQENVDSTTTNTDENSDDNIDEVKAELAKAKELANNYKIRAEKAEDRAKKPEVKTQSSKKEGDLSPMDIISLSKANIEADDVAEVMEYAKFKGISVTDAMKSNVVKTLLKENAEMRNVAQATNTGGSRRQTGKVSDETLLSNAAKGIMPESEEEMARLIKARRA